MHILILGGTTEANQLAALLAQRPDLRATLSLAGVTREPKLPPIPHRIGGFGGADGLAAWLHEHRVTALVDATHPFASRMPFNAEKAAHLAGIPLLALTRPAWQPQAGDRWVEVANHAQAVAALGEKPQRVFLTVGRLEIGSYAAAPQHFYLARTIEPVDPKPLPDAVWITARGPFGVTEERALMETHGITMLVTKNSGGAATGGKLAAARELGVPVILIRRPLRPQVRNVATAAEAMQWINIVSPLPLAGEGDFS